MRQQPCKKDSKSKKLPASLSQILIASTVPRAITLATLETVSVDTGSQKLQTKSPSLFPNQVSQNLDDCSLVHRRIIVRMLEVSFWWSLRREIAGAWTSHSSLLPSQLSPKARYEDWIKTCSTVRRLLSWFCRPLDQGLDQLYTSDEPSMSVDHCFGVLDILQYRLLDRYYCSHAIPAGDIRLS